MEIIFQNKREDMEAFFDYMLRETPEGKRLGKQAFEYRQGWMLLLIALLCSIYWGITGKGFVAFLLVIGFSVVGDGILFLISKFKPQYYFGRKVYKNQEKTLLPKEIQFFQLKRTLRADETGLEIRSSEAVHRWSWKRVDRIGITPNFVFIHVGNCPVVYVPKRDFVSEQSFAEFGKTLLELKEKNKDQPLGIE